MSKANQYAKDHGKTPFSIYHGKWSVLDRSFERDIIPMARAEGLALAPWDVLGGGKIREIGDKGRTVLKPDREHKEERKLCLILEQVAKEVGVESVTAGALHLLSKKRPVRVHYIVLKWGGGVVDLVAIAYLLHKTPYVFPIVGGRKVEHLKENIRALDITLSPEQIRHIDSAKPLDLGFPHNITVRTTPHGTLREG